MCPEENLKPPKPRRVQPISYLKMPFPRTRWTRMADRVGAVFAIILGVFYGAQFAMLLTDQFISASLGWSEIRGYWIWILLGRLILAALPVAAMSWGVIFCGVNVWRTRLPGAPLAPTNLFYMGGAWQGFMGVSSFSAGLVALLAEMSVLVWLV
jgi:hypothetical protein